MCVDPKTALLIVRVVGMDKWLWLNKILTFQDITKAPLPCP